MLGAASSLPHLWGRPFTDWTPSAFWGPGGELRTEAPVFSKLPRLPTMLGQFVHTFPLFRSANPEGLHITRAKLYQLPGHLRQSKCRGSYTGCIPVSVSPLNGHDRLITPQLLAQDGPRVGMFAGCLPSKNCSLQEIAGTATVHADFVRAASIGGYKCAGACRWRTA